MVDVSGGNRLGGMTCCISSILSLSTNSYRCLAVHVVSCKVSRHSYFPFIAISQELLLVIKQLFMSLRRKFKIGSLNNSVDWTGLLAVAAVNALRHVDIISRSLATTVLTHLGIYCDRLWKRVGSGEKRLISFDGR